MRSALIPSLRAAATVAVCLALVGCSPSPKVGSINPEVGDPGEGGGRMSDSASPTPAAASSATSASEDR